MFTSIIFASCLNILYVQQIFSQMGDADSVLGPYQSWHHFKALPSTVHTGYKGDTSWHLEAFPKCLGKKPSPPLARDWLRDFPE